MSPAINGFGSEVLIQALTGRFRCLLLMQNCRSGQCYSMNHPSEWLPHCAFKRYCASKKIVEEEVVTKILRHSMAVHLSALLSIVTAQGNLKLEITVEIIALASAVQTQLRKYCMFVGCLRRAHKKVDSIILASGSIQEAAPHVSGLLFYVEDD